MSLPNNTSRFIGRIRGVTLLYLICSLNLSAQDNPFQAAEIVEILAGANFKGRGYVKNGSTKTAKFIAGRFKDLGLQPIEKTYFQSFQHPVNTFPGAMKITWGTEELLPGEDYLISPGSPSVKGAFELINLDYSAVLNNEDFSQFLSRSEGKLIVVVPHDSDRFNQQEEDRIKQVLDFLKYHPDNPSAGTVELTDSKLTWSTSSAQFSKPYIIIKTSSDKTPLKATFDVEASWNENYDNQNVLGTISGKSSDSIIFLMAHYDHLGMMGKETVFPGANDNASGIAMLLNLAQYFSENQPDYDVVFAAFGGEELGLLGSKHFVENTKTDLSKVKFFLNFDIAGTGEEGIQVVNGSVYKKNFDKLVAINESGDLLPQVRVRGAACNSDHCWFDQKNIPGFYIYTVGGIQAYHDIYDRSETLSLVGFDGFKDLVIRFLEDLMSDK